MLAEMPVSIPVRKKERTLAPSPAALPTNPLTPETFRHSISLFIKPHLGQQNLPGLWGCFPQENLTEERPRRTKHPILPGSRAVANWTGPGKSYRNQQAPAI